MTYDDLLFRKLLRMEEALRLIAEAVPCSVRTLRRWGIHREIPRGYLGDPASSNPLVATEDVLVYIELARRGLLPLTEENAHLAPGRSRQR